MKGQAKNQPLPIDALRWYASNENNGRGRVKASDQALVKAGALRVEKTSFYCWRISITEHGRAILRKLGENG